MAYEGSIHYEAMPNETLISKKQLLDKYGFSYGALYRWKRKGLIPDDWFIKKATVTGQETYFPKDLICERIEMILADKEGELLDEIAKKIMDTHKASVFLTVKTKFGSKKFNIMEIESIEIEQKDGTNTDILEYVKNEIKE